MIGDTRAVSPAVTQALTIGISTILITGLLVAGSSFIESKQENTVRQGLQDVGTGVASDLVRLDQYDTTGLTGEISFRSAYPDRVGDEGYRIRIDSGSPVTIAVESTGSSLGTEVRLQSTTNPVCDSSIYGGPIKVVYDPSVPCLEVRDGDA